MGRKYDLSRRRKPNSKLHRRTLRAIEKARSHEKHRENFDDNVYSPAGTLTDEEDLEIYDKKQRLRRSLSPRQRRRRRPRHFDYAVQTSPEIQRSPISYYSSSDSFDGEFTDTSLEDSIEDYSSPYALRPQITTPKKRPQNVWKKGTSTTKNQSTEGPCPLITNVLCCCNFSRPTCTTPGRPRIKLHSGPGMTPNREAQIRQEAPSLPPRVTSAFDKQTALRTHTFTDTDDTFQIEVVPVQETFRKGKKLQYAEMDGIGMVFAPTKMEETSTPRTPRARKQKPWWEREGCMDTGQSTPTPRDTGNNRQSRGDPDSPYTEYLRRNQGNVPGYPFSSPRYQLFMNGDQKPTLKNKRHIHVETVPEESGAEMEERWSARPKSNAEERYSGRRSVEEYGATPVSAVSVPHSRDHWTDKHRYSPSSSQRSPRATNSSPQFEGRQNSPRRLEEAYYPPSIPELRTRSPPWNDLSESVQSRPIGMMPRNLHGLESTTHLDRSGLDWRSNSPCVRFDGSSKTDHCVGGNFSAPRVTFYDRTPKKGEGFTHISKESQKGVEIICLDGIGDDESDPVTTDRELQELAASEQKLRKQLEQVQRQSAERRWELEVSRTDTGTTSATTPKGRKIGFDPSVDLRRQHFDDRADFLLDQNRNAVSGRSGGNLRDFPRSTLVNDSRATLTAHRVYSQVQRGSEGQWRISAERDHGAYYSNDAEDLDTGYNRHEGNRFVGDSHKQSTAIEVAKAEEGGNERTTRAKDVHHCTRLQEIKEEKTAPIDPHKGRFIRIPDNWTDEQLAETEQDEHHRANPKDLDSRDEANFSARVGKDLSWRTVEHFYKISPRENEEARQLSSKLLNEELTSLMKTESGNFDLPKLQRAVIYASRNAQASNYMEASLNEKLRSSEIPKNSTTDRAGRSETRGGGGPAIDRGRTLKNKETKPHNDESSTVSSSVLPSSFPSSKPSTLLNGSISSMSGMPHTEIGALARIAGKQVERRRQARKSGKAKKSTSGDLSSPSFANLEQKRTEKMENLSKNEIEPFLASDGSYSSALLPSSYVSADSTLDRCDSSTLGELINVGNAGQGRGIENQDSVSSTSFLDHLDIDSTDKSLFSTLIHESPKGKSRLLQLGSPKYREHRLATKLDLGDESMDDLRQQILQLARERGSLNDDDFLDSKKERMIKMQRGVLKPEEPPLERHQSPSAARRLARLRKLQSKSPFRAGQRRESTPSFASPTCRSLKHAGARHRGSKHLENVSPGKVQNGISGFLDSPRISPERRFPSPGRRTEETRMMNNEQMSRFDDSVRDSSSPTRKKAESYVSWLVPERVQEGNKLNQQVVRERMVDSPRHVSALLRKRHATRDLASTCTRNSKELTKSIPRVARRRSLPSAKPGSLLWKAAAGQEG